MNSGSIKVPCPGTRGNIVYLAGEPMRAKSLYNAGACTLFVDFLDSGGSELLQVPIEPGHSAGPVEPPKGTAAVVVVCHEDCHGDGGLEFELVPILVA